ncbi:unnamed protein product [Cuscuta europaea]|uniref:Uncharacterized protein n=1 Tax=Cuscuta europaea TaxID=41803 RepID=A0A9P0YTK3_CUSEU|nr:unnamed protein product [Cuscuta europaea]
MIHSLLMDVLGGIYVQPVRLMCPYRLSKLHLRLLVICPGSLYICVKLKKDDPLKMSVPKPIKFIPEGVSVAQKYRWEAGSKPQRSQPHHFPVVEKQNEQEEEIAKEKGVGCHRRPEKECQTLFCWIIEIIYIFIRTISFNF